nr:hypothetical protein [Variovorax sp. OK605]
MPFNIFCGNCYFCQKELYSNCHDTNPEAIAVGGITATCTPPAATTADRSNTCACLWPTSGPR